jgi:predicted RNA-binding Zn ribbon-like protein
MAREPKEAPAELETVRSFVNTLDMDAGTDQLDAPAALVAWLSAHDLLAGGATTDAAAVDDEALARTLRLREALRAMLVTNNDGRPLDPSAPAVVDEVAARARLRLRASADGTTRLEAENGDVDGALGRLLVIVYRSMETGAWRRLKACRDDTCRWAFYDHSKNASGQWCSMTGCGSKQKARAYRQRHQGEKIA